MEFIDSEDNDPLDFKVKAPKRRQQRLPLIIVRNISNKFTEKLFRKHFEQWGKLVEVNLLKRADGKLAGRAYVKYETINQAKKAIQQGNGKQMWGLVMSIDWASDKNEFVARKDGPKEKIPKYAAIEEDEKEINLDDEWANDEESVGDSEDENAENVDDHGHDEHSQNNDDGDLNLEQILDNAEEVIYIESNPNSSDEIVIKIENNPNSDDEIGTSKIISRKSTKATIDFEESDDDCQEIIKNDLNQAGTSKKMLNTLRNFPTVHEIITSTPEGRQLMQRYHTQKMLSPAQRSVIANKIVEYHIENLMRITVSMCRKLADEVIEAFPTECIETYFLQPNKRRPPKGKLWDRYQTRRRALRKMDIDLLAYQRKKKPAVVEIKFDVEEMENERNILKNTHILEWETVKEKWLITSKYRKATLENSIIKAIELWPLYESERVTELVDIDYNVSFGPKEFNYRNWATFLKKFRSVFHYYLKDSVLIDILFEISDLDEEINSDNLAICIFKMLHGILKPHTVSKDGKKYSIADSCQSFTTEVKSINNFQNPYDQISIVVAGSKLSFKHFCVFFGQNCFEFDSYLDSIIFYFKLLQTLNIDFPVASKNVWVFIQHYFFDLAKAEKLPLVMTFINDVKQFV